MSALKPTPKYTLMDSSDTENWLIKIEEGEFKDVVYEYITVSVLPEPDEDGNGVMKFTYKIVYDNEMPEQLTPTSVKFVNTIGDILFNMIAEKFDNEST